jgi:hypothetical protein
MFDEIFENRDNPGMWPLSTFFFKLEDELKHDDTGLKGSVAPV